MITDKNLAKIKNVKHGFLTKNGGVSSDIFTSLNCGFGSNDTKENVEKNRKIALKECGLEKHKLLTLNQIHSNNVVVLRETILPEHETDGADGMVTDVPGIALGILTADCGPILFSDISGKIVGACHAGWRGAKNGVLEKTVSSMQKLGAKTTDIYAAIGPCIGPDSYEVGPEFYDNFIKETLENKKYFKKAKKPGKFLFDLPGYIEGRLKRIGVDNVSSVKKDTLKDEKNFFSFRRNTLKGIKDYGRLISIIGIK